MVIPSGHSTNAQHRQNRRRERPGSRTRRTVPRKVNSQNDFNEGILDARDNDVPLPSDKARPSPILRQNFDQSWQRWKAREAEEKALAEMDRMQLEQERMFGGDVGDDPESSLLILPFMVALALEGRRVLTHPCQELFSLGILYSTDEDIVLDSELNTVLCDVPVEASIPPFVIRHRRFGRSQRHLNSSSLPLYLSFSGLSDDADIARLLSPSIPYKRTIQHRHISFSEPIVTNTPQSLPTPSALESVSGSTSLTNSTTIFIPPQSFDQNAGDWEVVNTPQSSTPTPFSEPETWILIDDLQQIPH